LNARILVKLNINERGRMLSFRYKYALPNIILFILILIICVVELAGLELLLGVGFHLHFDERPRVPCLCPYIWITQWAISLQRKDHIISFYVRRMSYLRWLPSNLVIHRHDILILTMHAGLKSYNEHMYIWCILYNIECAQFQFSILYRRYFDIPMKVGCSVSGYHKWNF
jgi:hypothetical protein